ncbi:phosphoesterase family [Stylonychia lemnae]|uniref:Phosphoesterase family n=1 Tax=Stylonychia lemnae TaxID=5949 RepID=A0A078B694_STYLE|nr:phosphoesterase family [Stylonychia lemnae]|eukprot:CDW89746.1 phosphoesterase family [Stylonychia lemnae]
MNQSLNSQFAYSSVGAGDKSNSLKGKLVQLEDMITAINDEVLYHKKEVQNMRAEKESLENVLALKAQEVRKTLTNEANRIEEELKRNLAQQRAENTKLSQQISAIKTEKTQLQKNLLALQKRIQELELQIGGEDQPK